MKANEAPDKIYLRHNHKGDIGAGWLIFPLTNNDIEYVRKDAFVEKACSWLKENCKDYIIVDIDNKFEGVDGLFLEDFRNFMKGE